MTNARTLFAFLLLTASTIMCAASAGASENPDQNAYVGLGAVYVKADRLEQYRFLKREAVYGYIRPLKPVLGQAFEPESYDTPPNAGVRDCSDANFRCLALDDQAFAVPRKRLVQNDRYVANGNSFAVVKCIRGYKDICQVALIRAECYYNRIKKGCAPTQAERTGNDASWLLYFIYNEDFGVTAYGIAPLTGQTASPEEMLAIAKSFILVGDNGILKP